MTPEQREALAHSPVVQRFSRAAARRPGRLPSLALATVVSPDYDFPSFNLGHAELVGYLRHKFPNQAFPVSFFEPNILFGGKPELKNSVAWTLERLHGFSEL